MDRQSKEYKKEEMELVNTVSGGDGSNFHSLLFKLICKADKENKMRLAMGFPMFVDIVDRYQNEEGYWEKLIASRRTNV